MLFFKREQRSFIIHQMSQATPDFLSLQGPFDRRFHRTKSPLFQTLHGSVCVTSSCCSSAPLGVKLVTQEQPACRCRFLNVTATFVYLTFVSRRHNSRLSVSVTFLKTGRQITSMPSQLRMSLKRDFSTIPFFFPLGFFSLCF